MDMSAGCGVAAIEEEMSSPSQPPWATGPAGAKGGTRWMKTSWPVPDTDQKWGETHLFYTLQVTQDADKV